MKNLVQVILLCMASLWLFGCGPTTKGKEFDISNFFDISYNTGNITISPDLATQSGDTEQDVVAPTTTTNDVPVDLTVPLSSAASGLQSAIESEVSGKLQEATNDLKPSADVSVPTVEDADTQLGESLGSWSCSEYTRIPGNPKSACRIATDFKKHTYPVTFVFDNDCGSFTVASGVGRYEDLPNGKEDYVYYDYEKGTPAVFTQANCVASKVTAYKAD